MQNHETLVIPEITHDERIPKSVYEPTFVKSMVMVPIRSSSPIGAIGCYWADHHSASSSEVHQLQILANMTAIAMENCNHLIEIEDKARQLEKALEGTLISISRMVDLSDAYTSGHQNRVGALAYQIAKNLGLPLDHCQIIRWVGLVHDAGKIAIPTEILSKPSTLTLTEFKLVQTHSRMGHFILKDVEMNYPIADVVLQHHERLDGSGYPDGLVADQILADAKILAVADVFEAMVSHRPYRPAFTYEDALSELQRSSGILYDKMVVEALTKLVIDEKYIIS
jgi:HD-GYP domain-containing protein (c-di-GMP phosphodiesterase class II)